MCNQCQISKICHSLCLCRKCTGVNLFSPIRSRRWPSWSSGWDSIQDVVQPAVWNHWLKFSTIRLVLIEKTDMLSNYLDRFEKKNLFLLLACKALKYYSCCSVDRCWFHFSLWTSPVVFHIGIRPISPAFYNRLCFYGEKVVMLCVFGFALSGVDGSRVTWSTMTRWEGGGSSCGLGPVTLK